MSNDRLADAGPGRLGFLFARTAFIDAAISRFASARLGPLPVPLVVVALVYLANFILSLIADTRPGFDDREQLEQMGQWAWGYSGVQPPLHTWLVKLVDVVVQDDLAAVYATRFILLFLLATLLYQIARALQLSREGATAAAFGLFLMPPIGWEAQRAYSHSLSGLLFTALFHLAVLLVLRRKNGWTYVLAGVGAALAILGKYNGLLAIAGGTVALLAWRDLRALVRPRGVLFAAIAFAAVLALPLVWLGSRMDTLDDSVGKFNIPESGSVVLTRLEGILAFAGACLSYAGPLIALAVIAVLVALADGRAGRVRITGLAPETRYLMTAVATSFAIALVLVLVSGATEVKGYWLHPVLVTLPAVSAALLGSIDRTGWANRLVIFCALPLAVTTVAVFAFRAVGIGA